MPERTSKRLTDAEIYDPRWKTLYKAGGITGVLMTALTILAAVVYFIWPYKLGLTSPQDIFSTLHTDPFGGLMSLDFFYLVINFMTIPFFLGLYAAVRKVNESYALIALAFGLMCCILGIITRPIAEMFWLSGRWAAATTDAAKSQYLAAGEAWGVFSNGTAWMLYFIAYGIDVVISCLLMLRTKTFSRLTAFIGLFSIIGIFSIIPGFSTTVIGAYLNLSTTLIGTIWIVLVARTLFRLAKGTSQTGIDGGKTT